jgi:tetratricopeptide (TPR) repeat protein
MAKTAFGSDHLEVVGILNNLGVLYKYTGQFAEARRLYRRALEIMETVLGPDDSAVATLYHNLGGLEHACGRHAEGEPLARRSVEIRQKALGPDSVEVAADLAALAALLDGRVRSMTSPSRSTAGRC